MVSKKQRAKDALEFIPEITPLIRTQIAKKLECHPRTVRRAHIELLQEREKGQETVQLVEKLVSAGLYLQWFVITNCVLRSEDKATWLKRRMDIAQLLKKYQEIMRLDEKGQRIQED